MGAVLGQARTIRQAEIKQAQLACFVQVDVLGLDVAMQYVASMQHADGLEQLLGEPLPLRQR
ncbi:hypothetical protein D3C80_1426000 [compost metagenome]